MTATRDSHYARGVVFMLLAGSVAAINSPLFREVQEAGQWDVIATRNGSMFLTLLALLAWRSRGHVVGAFRAAGRPALAAGLILGLGNTTFALSVIHTTVANSLFILSASPFVAAGFAWLLLRERVPIATVWFMVAALLGVGIMVYEGLGAGRLFGNLMAVLTMLCHAGFVVSLRVGKAADMLPAVVIAGFTGTVIAMVAGAAPWTMTGYDVAVCLAMGAFAMSVGFVFFTMGSRHVPAAQVALLSLTEVVFGPVMVLVTHNEVPSALTLAGGAVVLTAVIAQALWGMRAGAPADGQAKA